MAEASERQKNNLAKIFFKEVAKMATKKTSICIGDLMERSKEISCAIEIIEDIERLKSYWMQTDEETEALVPYKGEETKVRLYDEIIKFIIENYG